MPLPSLKRKKAISEHLKEIGERPHDYIADLEEMIEELAAQLSPLNEEHKCAIEEWRRDGWIEHQRRRTKSPAQG